MDAVTGTQTGARAQFKAVEDLCALAKAEAASRDAITRQFRETLKLAQKWERVARGEESVAGHEVISGRWLLSRKLAALKEAAQTGELRDAVQELHTSFEKMWKEVETLWCPRELTYSPDQVLAKLAGHRQQLAEHLPEQKADRLPSPASLSPYAQTLRDMLRQKSQPTTDEELFISLYPEAFFQGHATTKREANILRTALTAAGLVLQKTRGDSDIIYAGLSELKELGWDISEGACAMRPIPPDYNGAAEAVLMLLGDGDAAKYLRRQLELRDRISALTKTKEQLEASTKPGALDGLRLWWLGNQLHHAQTSAQLQPDSFEQRDFNGCSRLPLLIDEAKNLDTAEQVLFGMGLRLAMRDMSLKLRWGSYQADFDGYRANAILVVEDLSDVGRRIKESERNYGYDFNRAKLGAHLFSYFLDLSVVREFAGQALELACAENDKADTAAIAGRIKAIFDSPEAVPSRTAELDSLYEDFDRAVLGEQFGSELDVVRTRMRRRLTLDYGLSAQEELLTPTALPFLRGMAAGLDIQFSEAFPALFNYWFGTSTHPLDHTPEADSFGDVTVANYVLSVNCPDPSSWDTVRRKLLDLIEVGALPKALAGQVGAKATDKDAAGLRCNAAQPVNLDGNYIKEALPSLEESLTRRLLNASGTRSDREKHTKALESLSELGVSIRIGLKLELADQKAKAA